ncbi:hypothetical protein GCM10009547_27360 [Sporichthya brevicatena]|uniref:Uncharacterized protein n=1 Tax=Sporichthya brevicatena TaxID=171442 RepID=A0ABN1GY50_9ACTN
MIKRAERGGVLVKRTDVDDTGEHDLFAEHTGEEFAAAAAAVAEEEPGGRSWTRMSKLHLALAALSATPVLFIGGLGGWPWDSEPAVAQNTVVAGQEHYPATLTFARLGINTELDPLTMDPVTQVLQVPDLGRAGWIESGPEPGQPGRAVVLGRRSQAGADVFAKLVDAKAGDRFTVTTQAGQELTFVVRSVEQFKAGQVPEKRIYGNGKAAQLRLITSTGAYDQSKGGFPRNVVVFADLAK